MIRQRYTAELSEQVRVLWFDGMEAEAIAMLLNILSPQSIVDHVHKCGYMRKPGFVTNKPGRPPAQHPAKIGTEPKPKLRNGEPITLVTAARDECRWMHGEGINAQLCAHRTLPGRSYCPHHTARSAPHTSQVDDAR